MTILIIELLTILLKLEQNIYLALCNKPSAKELHIMEKKVNASLL